MASRHRLTASWALAASCAAVILAQPQVPTEGDYAQLWDCNASSPFQTWLVETGNPFPNAHITLSGSFNASLKHWLVLDINDWANVTGAAVHVWYNTTGDNGYNEQWEFSPGSGGSTIKSKMNGMCLTASGPSPGAVVNMQGCSHALAPFQTWTWDSATGLIAIAANPSSCLDAGTFVNCSLPPLSSYPYCNPDVPLSTRVSDLVNRILPEEYGSLMGNSNNGLPRLGVPRIQFGECLHGTLSRCGAPYTDPATGYTSTGCPTSFPHLSLQGSSLNRTLWALVAAAVGDEDRGLHNQGIGASIFWAPDINPFRDPRWGRGQEVAGEDPTLLAEFAAVYVAGLQGGPDPNYKKIVSTCKHFSAYDMENSEGYSRHTFAAGVTTQDLVQYYWPPFKSCVQRAKAGSIMCSYNAVTVTDAGSNVTAVPSCANGYFNNDIVRGQWGWDGFMVSDCGAIKDIQVSHNYTKTYNETVRAAFSVGGTDTECDSVYAQFMNGAFEAGYVSLADMQAAATRLFTQVFSLGLLDPPGRVSYNSYGADMVDTAAHRQLALEGAQQGITLLQNNKTNLTIVPNAGAAPLLPIPRSALGGRTVALLGPNAAATQQLLSNYHGTNLVVNQQSILAALNREAAAHEFFVAYAPGCIEPVSGNASIACASKDGFQAAIDATINSRAAIIVVGLCANDCPSTVDTPVRESEGWDRVNITLPGHQEELIQTIVGLGKPVVVILVHGGAVAIDWTKANVPAILDAHYPGEMGGDAVMSVLFGDVSPSGRLVTTAYTSAFTSQRRMNDMVIPPHTDPVTGQAVPGITYLYYDQPVLWPFGWGLSYTTFTYKWFTPGQAHQVVHARVWADGAVAAPAYSVNITNTGKVASDVSVMAFLTNPAPSSSSSSSSAIRGVSALQPLQELFDFGRVAGVQPGQTVTLTFTPPAEVVATVSRAGEQALTPGVYGIRIGDVEGSPSGDYVEGSLTVVGEAGEDGQEKPVVLWAMPPQLA